MAIKCFKCEVPELNRKCITGIIELPLKEGLQYEPGIDEEIVSISFSPVDGHPELLTIAIMLENIGVELEDAERSTHDC